MAYTDTRSVDEIRREAERSRSDLTQTVHQLRDTVSGAATDLRQKLAPESIKAEVSGYVRTRGETLMDAARRNPMQTAAIGALVGYPLARMVRSIPLPLMMIGAGLFLTGSESGKRISRQAADRAADLADQARRAARDVSDSATQAVSSVREKASTALAGVQSPSDETAAPAMETAQTVVESAADSAQRYARSATDTARQTMQAGVDTARDALEELRRRGAEPARTITQWAMDNPLAVAGVGLVVGGFVASALPRTDVETRVAGVATKGVRSAAAHGAVTALGAATGAVADIATRAASSGFGPQGVSTAALDENLHRTQPAPGG